MDHQPTAVFRFDANPEKGGGHAMRSGVLARELQRRGWLVVFAVNEKTLSNVPWLARGGTDVLIVDAFASVGLDQSKALVSGLPGGCDVLIVDDYDIDEAFESYCRGWAKKIIAIDDLADRGHDCDVLLDVTFGRGAGDYAKLVQPGCRMLLGPEYALLDPAFAKLRPNSLARHKDLSEVKRIFVSFGLADPVNMTARVLEGLRQSGFDGEVDVAIGSMAKHLPSVRDGVAKLTGARLHLDADSVAELIAAADCVIGGGGGMTLERCVLGVACVTVAIADNQTKIVEELKDIGAIVSLGWHEQVTSKDIAEIVARLVANPEELCQISATAASICDGEGARRVADIVEGG